MDENDIDIYLFEDVEEEGSFRTQNAPGEKFRPLLVDRGEALITKARVVGITHGAIGPSQEPATLLIFEFHFVSMRSGRRFIRATVTLKFEDADGNTSLDPDVYAIAPDGKFALNRTERVVDTKLGLSLGANAGVKALGTQAGIIWETSEVKTQEYCTSFLGVKRLQNKRHGNENAVIWSMEENRHKREGIPSFFRAAVLLKRKDDVPFSFTIKVQTDVDFIGQIKTLVGMERKDPVDPVEVDPKAIDNASRVGALEPQQFDLARMERLELGDVANVVIATAADGSALLSRDPQSNAI